MKGDTLTVHVDEGNTVRPIIVSAHKSGRRVDYSLVNEQKIDWLVVTERTRGGTLIHEVRMPLSRAIAIVTERRDDNSAE